MKEKGMQEGAAFPTEILFNNVKIAENIRTSHFAEMKSPVEEAFFKPFTAQSRL